MTRQLPSPPENVQPESLQLVAPKPLAKVNPFVSIEGAANSIESRYIQMSDPNKVQEGLVELDNILKDVAQLQRTIGQNRKNLGLHIAKLRKAHPRGKPSEGEIKVLPSGQQIIFIDGSWNSYTPTSAKEG